MIARGQRYIEQDFACYAGVRMSLQVHDELVFEVPEAEVEATVALVKGEGRKVSLLPAGEETSSV